ncbi:hypothetical protein C2S51_012164 [Perilla frutescens var. frutescens]|nr:hypothetical protein C2S51_012164 [Perilla frutescens var. frutescens]
MGGARNLDAMIRRVIQAYELSSCHSIFVKLYGYISTSEVEHPFVAYEFKPFDSLFNLIPKDDLTWLQRIKVVLGLASLLKFLHKNTIYKPFIVHNLDAAYVVLDEDYNPKLCDFGLLSCGIFPEKKTYSAHDIIGCYGYLDMSSYNAGIAKFCYYY